MSVIIVLLLLSLWSENDNRSKRHDKNSHRSKTKRSVIKRKEREEKTEKEGIAKMKG